MTEANIVYRVCSLHSPHERNILRCRNAFFVKDSKEILCMHIDNKQSKCICKELQIKIIETMWTDSLLPKNKYNEKLKTVPKSYYTNGPVPLKYKEKIS
jgi:hypothetical protein